MQLNDIIFNKMLLFIVLAYLVENSIGLTSSPTWGVNVLLNSGEHKGINGTLKIPSTGTAPQNFNKAFSSIPRVILSLQGYRQDAPPCSGCSVGFKYEVFNITSSGFMGKYTIYGANMYYLFYNYMGIANAANQYFISYQLLTFSTGNLVDVNSSSRSITQIISNPAGQLFTNYATSPVANIVFLAGFRMNLGTTGTYINVTSAIVSANSYSITISTIADIQIFQICYFRIAFDKNAAMQGYTYLNDYFYYQGVNSTQIETKINTNFDPYSFQYRNYLMGFNQIHIAGTNVQTDIMLQFYTPPGGNTSNQTIYSCIIAKIPIVPTNTTYAYLWADTFHLRKRICGSSTPFFYYSDFFCYDVCPAKTYSITNPSNYCENCHYSCLICNGRSNTNCLTCSSSQFRIINNVTKQCLCIDGYFDNGTAVCTQCSIQCATCINSTSYCLTCAKGYYGNFPGTPITCLPCDQTCLTCSLASNNCTSCDSPNKNRVLSNSSNTCICADGFYQSFTNNTMICLACDPNCLTCSITSTNCTSCNSTQKRVLNSSNICICSNSFYEISPNNPITCLACSPTCVTCTTSANFCTQCDLNNQRRTLNQSSQTCICTNGFHENSPGTPIICLACDATCQTCQSSSTYCLTCNATHNRNINNNTCICLSGFFETSAGSPLTCTACHPTCKTCASSSTSCQSCHQDVQHRILNSNSSACQCAVGYYERSLNDPTECLTCNPSCITCSSSATNCLSCNPTDHHRSLNASSNSCQCMVGFYQTSTNIPTVCLTCGSTCRECISSASLCLSCKQSQNRTLNASTNSCPCIAGYYETSLNTPQNCLSCSITCKECSSSAPYCLSCHASQNRIFNSANNTCICQTGYYETSLNMPQTCLSCSSRCQKCEQSQTNCLSCKSIQNRIHNATTNTCLCVAGYYQIPSNTSCLPCDSKCLTCQTNSTTCTSCNETVNRYLDNTTRSCECLNGFLQDSNNPIGCQCMIGYYINLPNRTCLKCDAKCRTCISSQNNCQTCNTTKRKNVINGTTGSCVCNDGTQQSQIIYGLCVPKNTNGSVCGNGYIQTGQQCDDFNLASNDGCSNACTKQQNHNCGFYSNLNGTSLCYYDEPLNMSISSVLKQLNDNKITIVLQIQALLINLQKLKQYLDKMTAIQLLNSRRMLQRQYDNRLLQTNQIIYITSSNFVITNPTNYQGLLNLQLQYNQSISTLNNKKLKFINSNSQFKSQYFFNTPHTSIQLQDPYNNVPITFYPAESYKNSLVLSYIFFVFCCLNLLYFLIMVFLKKSVIAIQSILILQIAYFCIICQRQVQLAIGSFAYWGRYTIGANIRLFQIINDNNIINSLSCNYMGKIYQTCDTLNNINITFYLATALFIFLIGCSIHKYRKQKKMNEQFSQQTQNNDDHEHVYLNYYFPKKIKQVYFFSLQFVFGIYFMTAIQFLLSIINQQKQMKIYAIVYTVIIGLLFVGLWVYWVKLYPIHQLSYFQVLIYRVQKISIHKLFYLSIFVGLVIWGAIIGIKTIPAVVPYALLIVLCLYWIFATLRSQVYKHKLNKIRATINQITTILIVIIYILLQYVPNDGLGLMYAIGILVLLFISSTNNIVISIYMQILQRTSKVKDDQQFKQVQEDMYKNQSPTSRVIRKELQQLSQNKYITTDNKQFNFVTPRRQPLMQGLQMAESINSKVTQLKSFRRQLKIPSMDIIENNRNVSDQKKVQISSSINVGRNY